MDIRDLAWTLAFGACFGGNGTLVGAGANLVCESVICQDEPDDDALAACEKLGEALK